MQTDLEPVAAGINPAAPEQFGALRKRARGNLGAGKLQVNCCIAGRLCAERGQKTKSSTIASNVSFFFAVIEVSLSASRHCSMRRIALSPGGADNIETNAQGCRRKRNGFAWRSP